MSGGPLCPNDGVSLSGLGREVGSTIGFGHPGGGARFVGGGVDGLCMNGADFVDIVFRLASARVLRWVGVAFAAFWVLNQDEALRLLMWWASQRVQPVIDAVVDAAVTPSP